MNTEKSADERAILVYLADMYKAIRNKRDEIFEYLGINVSKPGFENLADQNSGDK